jgi:hypothetical protein
LVDVVKWAPLASDGAKFNISHERTASGAPVLRIDFDFTAGAGYGGAFLDLPIELPENYEFTLVVRGEGPANNLELKLVDPEKLNVWWVNRRAYEWPAKSTRLANQRRHFQFAWGPSGGEPLYKLGRVELIIAANEGGRGTVWVEELKFTPLPPAQPYSGKPVVSGSSGARDLSGLLEGAGTPWVADPRDAHPWLAVDFEQPRDIGGMVVHRPADHAPANFDIEVSDDGNQWTSIRRVRGAGVLPSEIALPDLQTRWLRLAFDRTEKSPIPAVSRIQFLDTADGASPNAFWRTRAARAARGLFPRTLLNEQSFWTVIGQPGDDREALINEEGQIEVDRRGFSIEPFIVRGGKLLTWADGAREQSLRDGWIPIPSVIRRHDGIELTTTALAAGESGASAIHAGYTLHNTSGSPSRGRLVLALRPIQVLPPWQDLNITGGWTAVQSIRTDADGVIVNELKEPKRVYAAGRFDSAASGFDSGDAVELLSRGIWATGESVSCPERSASGLIWWEFDLAPGASTTFVIAVPFQGVDPPANRPADAAEFEALAKQVASDWTATVDHVKFRLPTAAKQFHDTIRATQAYILINHDWLGFQPGSRTYNRSWIRDGSMTSAAMIELGHEDLVRRFIDWYAPYQFPSGKVPCVVDRRGADPVNEHDSHGQLIWLIANFHRYTGDTELVRRHFPRVKLAVEYIESLRAQRMTGEFGPNGAPRQEPGKPNVPALAFRGLVPESISHEGYSAKPMHSFWDTFYILRGLKDAAYLAEVAGESKLAKRWQALADDFRTSLIDSIRLVHEAHGIDYLPGCVELGDFDSTSSTILLWPVEERDNFPREWIDATFDRAWREFTTRRDKSPATWDAYTPYELRHVGAYIRLGKKDRAWAALDWYFSHQRPAGWRHWAEVVHRDPMTPRMIGDMPHTWCGSDFLNAARAMFVYEDHSDEKLVLFAGVPDAWFADPTGVGFERMPTEYGDISAQAEPDGSGTLKLRLSGTAKPPGGIELCVPLAPPIRSARVDGKPTEVIDGNRVRIGSIPATIEFE